MLRFPIQPPAIHMPEVHPANPPVETHATGAVPAADPNVRSHVQPFVQRHERTRTRVGPYAGRPVDDAAASASGASVPPRHSVSQTLQLDRARLTQSIDHGMQRELELRCAQYWTSVHVRIWADHARSCEREFALTKGHLEQQQLEASRGNPMAPTNIQIVNRGLPSLQQELERTHETLDQLTRYQERLPNEIFRTQQALYQQLAQRGDIDRQLQSLERGGSPPRTGS